MSSSSPRRPRNKLRKAPPSSFISGSRISLTSSYPHLQLNLTQVNPFSQDHDSDQSLLSSSPSSAVTVSVCSQAPLTHSLRRASTAPSRKLTKPKPSFGPLHNLPRRSDLTSFPSIPLPPPSNPSPIRPRAVSESGYVNWSPVRAFSPFNLTPRVRRTSFHIGTPLESDYHHFDALTEDTKLRSMVISDPLPPFKANPQSQFDILPVGAMSARPKLTRNDAAVGVRRRWTLATAMTDDRITDEVFVHELENMRTHLLGTDGDTEDKEWIEDISDSHVYVGSRNDTEDIRCPPAAPSHPSLTWKTARHALLTCRELVRTERSYNWALRKLLTADTSTPPPPLMLTYLSALSAVSDVVLERMEADPSAWGVAVAFIAGEDDLESAYVGWCGVVGGFFVDKADDRKTRWPRRTWSAVERGGMMGESSTGSLRRTVSAWRKSMPSIASLNTNASHAPLYPVATSGGGSGNGNGKERAKPSVRDLAILPTQRVTRYVLLYQDLLAHTPSTSPSRALVERAVDAAVRVAQKCDRAQGNAEFFLR